MRNRLVLVGLLLSVGLTASEIQKSTTESLCKTLENLFGATKLSFEGPYTQFSTMRDWIKDTSGQFRSLPGARMSYSYTCNVDKGIVEIKSHQVHNSEQVIEGKIELKDFGYLLETEKYIVDEQGKLRLEHTFQSPFAPIAEDRVPRTHNFEVILDANAASLTTQIVIDDMKTDKKSCSDDTQSPPTKVACRAEQKSTQKRESETRVVTTREKTARFYDKDWKFIPNVGWNWGPEVVHTNSWKEVQQGYAARNLRP